MVGKIEGISFVYFDERDVVRHSLVQRIIRAYDEYTVDHSGASSPGRPARTAGVNLPRENQHRD